MNNEEIKEILKDLELCSGIFDYTITPDRCTFLKDYITNLQENYERIYNENCKLREKHNITDISLLDENYKLQEENEKNKTYSEFYKDMSNKWKDLLDVFKKDYYDYKLRNEKANTLLDEMLEIAYIDGEYIMYDYSTSELLEVKQALQGEDKE